MMFHDLGILAAIGLFVGATVWMRRGWGEPQILTALMVSRRGKYVRSMGYFFLTFIPLLTAMLLDALMLSVLDHTHGLAHDVGHAVSVVVIVVSLGLAVVGIFRNPVFGYPAWLASVLNRRLSGQHMPRARKVGRLGSTRQQVYDLLVRDGRISVMDAAGELGLEPRMVDRQLKYIYARGQTNLAREGVRLIVEGRSWRDHVYRFEEDSTP